ncbi:MAG: hypothetical protein WCO19_05465, partial [Candidatus Saccharibacteria bacterium]
AVDSGSTIGGSNPSSPAKDCLLSHKLIGQSFFDAERCEPVGGAGVRPPGAIAEACFEKAPQGVAQRSSLIPSQFDNSCN